MGYVNPHSDLGAVVTMMDGGDADVGRMQAAINRVLMNAPSDPHLQTFLRDIAKAARTPFPAGPGAPIPVTGKADDRTLVAASSAAIVAGAVTTATTNAALTEKLEAFSDSRGYPPGDTVAQRILGVLSVPASVGGIPIKTVAIGGALLLGAFLFFRRRSA